MCEPVTIGMGVMAAVGAVGAISGQKDQATAIGDKRVQQQKQAVETIKQMNYKDAELQGQDRDNYDSAVRQLTDANINTIRNAGLINAAFAESGVEGRSVDAVIREVAGSDARNQDSIKAGYTDARRGIQSASETNRMQAQAAIQGMGTIRGPSAVSSALSVINGGLSGAAQGAALGSAYKAANAPAPVSTPKM